MKRCYFVFLFLQAQQIFSYTLEYNSNSHQYEDLLISISPDIPGLQLIIFIRIKKSLEIIKKSFSETNSQETIQNIKDLIIQASCPWIFIKGKKLPIVGKQFITLSKSGMGAIQSGVYQYQKKKKIIKCRYKLSIPKVYILVPYSWSQIEGSEAAHQVHEDADIRVEVPNSLYGDTPFTLQTGECGEQGEYIQVIL